MTTAHPNGMCVCFHVRAVFVEIGSSEEQWGRVDAAEVWASALTR